MQPKTPPTLIEILHTLPGPRVAGRCDHLLHGVRVMAVCAMLAGGQSFNAMEDFSAERENWLRGFPALPGGIPRHDTFDRATLRRVTFGLLLAAPLPQKSLRRKR